MRPHEIVRALRRLRVETGSLACAGCGHEHNCGIHGCAIIRGAGNLSERPRASTPGPNQAHDGGSGPADGEHLRPVPL